MNKRIGRWSVVWAAASGWAVGVGGCASSAPTPPPSSQAASTTAPPGDAAGTGAPAAAPAGRPGESALASADGAIPVALAAATPAAPAAGGVAVSGGGGGPVAMIDTPRGQVAVSSEQFLKPLVEAHGLNVLLLVVQLELAKDQALANGLNVTPQELAAERDATLGKLFEQSDAQNDEEIERARKANLPPARIAALEAKKKSDRDQLLANMMDQQRISPAELEIVLQTNTYLRKVAEKDLRGRIPEDLLRREFADRYNELVRVRHIAFDRPQDVVDIQRRLTAGEPFENVAKAVSKNPATAAMGGLVPPFAKSNANIPETFREAAFALKEGEVSGLVTVQTKPGEAQYHLIKLVERIAPKLVKFENVRAALERDLIERAATARMGQLRTTLGQTARDKLRITDPALAEQFKKKMADFDEKVKAADRERILLDAQKGAGQKGAGGPAAGPAAPGAAPGGTIPIPPGPVAPAPATPLQAAPKGPAAGAAPAFGPGPAAPAGGAPPAAATPPAGAATRPAGSPN